MRRLAPSWKSCRNFLAAFVGAVLTLGAVPLPATAQDAVAREEVVDGQQHVVGLNLDLYKADRNLEVLARPVEGQTPNVSLRVDRPYISGPLEGFREEYIAHFHGELLIQQPGEYTFEITSDDGSRLLIRGQTVIDNNGTHGSESVVGRVTLEAGVHPLDVWYFQATGGQDLSLRWALPGQTALSLIPAEAMRCEAGQTRVVSPGPKRVVNLDQFKDPNLVPGTKSPLEAVHPMWRLVTLDPQGPEGFKLTVGGMAYLPGGRLAISTFDPRNNGKIIGEPNGKVWLLDGVDGDSADVRVSLIDDQVFNPLGLLFHEGSLYLAQRDELTRYDDSGDGSFSERSTVSNGWVTQNYHHFTFGPVYKDGHFYVALSTSIGTGGQKVTRGASFGYAPNADGRGSVVKVDPNTGDIEYITGGHRTPNGLFLGPDGELLVGDNQGAWQPANKINHVVPGRFYGHYNGNHRTEEFPEGAPPSRFADQPLSPPAVYLPHNEIANSPTDGVALREGPFAGQILVSDVKHGGLRRISLEKVNGEYQGAAFRHSQGFNAGLNRLSWGEDGTLYVGGIGERRSWSWQGTTAGLQRLEPTGQTTFEFQNVTATPAGLRLRYTRPVPAEQLQDLGSYEIQQWNYRPTSKYGGNKHNVEILKPESVEVASDRRSVTLTIPGLKAGRVVYLVHPVTSDDGEAMWSPEVWYSMNQIPGRKVDPADMAEPMFRMLVFSKTEGYRHKNIDDGKKALGRMAGRQGWDVVFTEDADLFTVKDLDLFDAVVFLSTTGDILDRKQQVAFVSFIRGGGGFVGIHAATDTEHDWPWYNQLVGGYFAGHPKVQPGEIDVLITDHPSTAHLPDRWKRTDEWYDFKDMVPSLNVLMNLDESTYEGGKMGEDHPIAWYREFDGGRSWYTAGGHTAESFSEEAFLQHIQGGIEWAGGLKD